MGQKVHPIGFRLGVIKTWDSQVVRGEELREVAARGHQAPRVREEEAQPRRHLQGRDRARREQGEGQRPHRAPGHRHRQARRGHRDPQEGPPAAHRERGLPQHRRGPQGRDRRAARRREHRDPARAPHRLPPRHEEGGPDRDEVRRQGHPRRVLRPPRRRRDGALRVVPRGPRAAAHAARRHRLRLRRGADDLRQDRRQGLDLQGRGAARDDAGARRRSRPAASADAGDEEKDHASADANEVPQDAEGPHAREGLPRLATSPSATSACRPSSRLAHRAGRSRPPVSRSPAT